ncbi:unnamed protein product [Moneuplotes crassus]|uniref:Uncharacterized protein n=1 Tax=Euplotes crassus TaxID=5936 RepID=A0AAD2D9W5_EUPCR|nr:unnamed protein product [Moneuplotes crassus]
MEQTKHFWHLTTSKASLTEPKTPKFQPQLYKPEFPSKELKRHRKRRSKDYEQLFSEIHTTTPKTPLPTPNSPSLPLQNPPSTQISLPSLLHSLKHPIQASTSSNFLHFSSQRSPMG